MKTERLFKHTQVILIISAIVAGMAFVLLAHFTQAQSGNTFSAPIPLTGYLWAGTHNANDGSRQGLGWISLNCTNDTSGCTESNYRVQINPDKTVTGYAWIGVNDPTSTTLGTPGWVQFGGLSGCPAGDCTARVVGANSTGWEFAGWARALSHSDPEAGGWDGWISLNCSNNGGCGSSAYAARFSNSGDFPSNANAWGADVMGRVNFAFADFTPPCNEGNYCTADNTGVIFENMWCENNVITCSGGQRCDADTSNCVVPTPVTGDLVLSAPLVRSGGTVEVSWTASNATSCEVRRGLAETITVSGATSDPITAQTTFTLYCTDNTMNEVQVDSETIEVVPSLYST